MEIILAIVVAVAVVFFGALISAGNERQRKAIDRLGEQLILWAVQDLRIKRETLTRDVRVDDPLVWFNKIVRRVTGNELQLQTAELLDEPKALVFHTEDNLLKVVFTPHSPVDIRRMSRGRNSRLSQYTNQNPLLPLPRATPYYELSLLNSGLLFDMELQLAWKGLTGQELEQWERLWVYKIAN